MWQINLVPDAAIVLCWVLLVVSLIYTYRKQGGRETIWKLLLVYFVGVFSFSFTITYFKEPLQIAILPLGVWLLYAVLVRRGSWERYRRYAWIGFFSNYLFLVSTLIAFPVQDVVYAPDELTTYVADASEARVYTIHNGANETVQLVPHFQELAEQAQLTPMQVDDWYYDSHFLEEGQLPERFPYVITGVQARWGSGYTPSIYVEKDGKGLLIVTNKQSRYYRTEQSLLRGEGMQ